MVMRVLIMAGGTGGHVFPALAVAEVLRARGAQIVWLGTRRGLEARVVPGAGLDMEWLTVEGLRGKGVGSWLAAPFRIALALIQAVRVILRRRPAVVLGMGGYAAGPGGLATWLLRIPLLVHEQNAVAGMTNRFLARLATRVLTAFPGTFPDRTAAEVVGNPVRAALTAVAPPAERMAGRSGALRVLVVGGSLGARVLNEVVPAAAARMSPRNRPDIWHQTGERHMDFTRRCYQRAGIHPWRLEPFIDDMAGAYAWADVVICRAGALTVAELAAAGVGAILVPYPHAVDDHQARNADHMVEAGAALVVAQQTLTPAYLSELLEGFTAGQRGRLVEMACSARTLARPDAAERIASLCMEAACD